MEFSCRPDPVSSCPAEDLPLVGVTPFSTVDYPGYMSAVFFTQGCVAACRYCHNAHLRPLDEAPPNKIAWADAEAFLDKRKKKLEAVVFSGGEPTLHPELADAMKRVKSLGYRVGLHTAGFFPKMLKTVLSLCDWVGLDVKAPFADYERITGLSSSGPGAKESARLIVDSGVEYEFRTTIHPELLTEEHIRLIASEIRTIGAQAYYLQEFRPHGCQDERLLRTALSSGVISDELRYTLLEEFKSFGMRVSR